MATATEKADGIENFLTGVFGVDRRKAIGADICVSCKLPVQSFKDKLSAHEYRISGLCQRCQDEVFGGVE